MKKYRKYIIPLILLISILANLYYFVALPQWKAYKGKLINQGIVYVFAKAKELGEVRLTIEGETIVLTPTIIKAEEEK